MNNSIKGVNSKEIKIQLKKAEFQKNILIKNIYKEYEIYLKIVRKSILASVKKGIFGIYSNLSVSECDKTLNKEELVNFLKQNISFLVNSKLPLVTIEQLKLGNVIYPQKHNVNEKALKESVESKDYRAVDFDYDNDIISEKSFEFNCSNNSDSCEYYELLDEEKISSVNFDENEYSNSFSKQISIKNTKYEKLLVESVLEIIEEKSPNKLNKYENLNNKVDDFFISGDNLNFFETIDKAFSHFLLNLSYEINSELFKVNIINKNIAEDKLKRLSNKNIIKHPYPFVIKYDFNLNKLSELSNKFPDIYLFNISNIELEFYNLDLSMCRNKIIELKNRFKLLNKKEIYWKNKELYLNNIN